MPRTPPAPRSPSLVCCTMQARVMLARAMETVG